MQQQGSSGDSYAINYFCATNSDASKGVLSFLRSDAVHGFLFRFRTIGIQNEKNPLYVRHRIGDFSLFFGRTLGVKAKSSFFQRGKSYPGNFVNCFFHSGHARRPS